MNYNTNIRSNGQLREGSVSNVHINESAAIALSKLAEIVIKADGQIPFSGNQSMGGNRLTNVGAPVLTNDAANKNYVIESLKAHKVAAVCDSNLENLEGLPVVDGYQLQPGNLLLLVNQTNKVENGIWQVSATNWVRNDILSAGSNAAGTFVFITHGAKYKNAGFICTSLPGSDVVGVNDLTFRQFVTKELGVFYDTLKVYTSNEFKVINTDESNAVTISHDQLAGFIKTISGNLSIIAENGNANVGINNSDPMFSLDVNGDLNFSGALRKNGVDIGNSFLHYEPFCDVFTASEGQMYFTLTGQPFSSTNENWISVTRNGLQLEPSEYQITKVGTTYQVQLSTSCSAGDVVVIRPFALATVISAVDIPENGMMFIPEELQVGYNSVHIRPDLIYGDDPDKVNGQTLRIDIKNGDATFARDLTIGRDASIARNLGVTGNLTIGNNSLQIRPDLIYGDDPDNVNGQTLRIDIKNGDATFARDLTIGQDASIARNLGVTGNLTVTGDIILNGGAFTVTSQQVQVADNLIIINKNEIGNGVTAGYAGIEIERGTAVNYQFMFRESDDTFVIGEPTSLQAVATREDTPNANGIMHWDSTTRKMKTRSDCYINANGYLYAARVYNAVWNDIAECMPSDGTLQPGDLAQIDLRNKSYYRLTKYHNNFDAFIGIVSENPGFVVGENPNYENPVYIVLRGMVYTNKLGIFPVGTMLYLTPDGIKTRSDIAFKYNHFDVIYIGKVIESYDDKIRIFI